MLDVLAGGDAAPPGPPDAPPRAWELFLRAERCALPLRRRLTALHIDDRVPADCARVLAALALEEMQRVISARAQLHRIAGWASEADTRVLILKGAVAALDDAHAIDLSDVDLLVEPSRETQLLKWLAQSGHTPKPAEAAHHHASRLADQLVSIEVHHEVPLTDLDAGSRLRSQPITSTFPALRRLPAGDHLWHVLVHSTVQHIDRRGRLRDLLLTAHALSLCAPEVRAAVHDRAARHPEREVMLATMAMAGAIESGTPEHDAFTPVAAARYLAITAEKRRPATRFLHSGVATTAALYGFRGWKLQFEPLDRSRNLPSPVPALRALQRISPRLGGSIVFGLRWAKRMVGLLYAIPRARAARRLARSLPQ